LAVLSILGLGFFLYFVFRKGWTFCKG